MATFGPVAPIQYQVPTPNPLGGLGQGFQLGAMMEQAQAARESRALQQQQIALVMQQRRQQMEAARQAAEQRKAAQAALARSFTKPITQWTGEDVAALTAGLDKEQLTAFQNFTSTRSDVQKSNDSRFYGQVLSAFKSGKSDVAARLLTERSEGETDKNEKKVFSSLAQSALEAPDATAKQLALMNASLGDKYLKAMQAVFPEPTEAFKVLTPAEAKARGLPTQGGAQWQVNTKTGKVERLVEGEKPGPSFETLTAAQLTAKYGLTGVEPGLYKRRSDTGEISKIGGGGTTINMKTVSPPPKDYRYVYDGQGNVERMEVIPGSKTAKDLETAAAAAQARTQTEIGRANIIVDSLNTLENLIKTQTTLDPVTGRTGALMGQAGAFKAGSKRADAEQAIDAVIANIGFAELNKMRRESPNGAALGNVTERELAFLQRVVGSLDLIQSDPQLLKNIGVIREIQNKVINEGLSDADIARYSAMLGLKAKEAAPASRRAEGVVTPAATAATPFPVAPQPTVKRKSLEEIFSGTPAAR